MAIRDRFVSEAGVIAGADSLALRTTSKRIRHARRAIARVRPDGGIGRGVRSWLPLKLGLRRLDQFEL